MKPLTPELVRRLQVIIDRAQEVGKQPSFQFYTDDWLGSGSIAEMSPAQEGAYIRLLAHCASNARLSMTSEPERLSVMSRLNHDWRKLGPAVLANFASHPFDKGRLTCAKLIEVRYNSIVRATAGAEGGKKTQAKGQAKPQANRQANGQAETKPSYLPPSGLPPSGSQASSFTDSVRSSAPASPDAPADEPPTASPERTFAQQCVDRALVSYEKRYCITRQLTAYPGGQKALAKGYGVVLDTLAGLAPDFPRTKAQAAARTEKELKHTASVVQVAWVGYLDRAAEIDKLAHEIPGKDGTWLRFPSTPVMFCKRHPQLTPSDVDAVRKRVSDVAEAKRNSRQANPGSAPTIRYGAMEKVIP